MANVCQYAERAKISVTQTIGNAFVFAMFIIGAIGGSIYLDLTFDTEKIKNAAYWIAFNNSISNMNIYDPDISFIQFICLLYVFGFFAMMMSAIICRIEINNDVVICYIGFCFILINLANLSAFGFYIGLWPYYLTQFNLLLSVIGITSVVSYINFLLMRTKCETTNILIAMKSCNFYSIVFGWFALACFYYEFDSYALLIFGSFISVVICLLHINFVRVSIHNINHEGHE